MRVLLLRVRRNNLLAIASALLLVSCTQETAKPKVSINVLPIKSVTKTLDTVPNSKADAPASNHEIAQTDWIFSIVPELTYKITKEQKEPNGCHVWIEITGINLTLALPVKTSISSKAPKYVVEHEKGHVEICKRVYEHSREAAEKAANSVIGKTFEGWGPDLKKAVNNAWQNAGQDIASPYRVAMGRADRVSMIYDQLCEKEDRTKLVGKTVEDAFAAIAKEDLEESKQDEKKTTKTP